MKAQYPAKLALQIAISICAKLGTACKQIEIAGSLRRRKREVGDIEILYISKMRTGELVDVDLFGTSERPAPRPLADIEIGRLESNGTLERRKNVKGNETFGERIKLMRHIESGIPIDFFACAPESWFNYLVCRTGGAESNTRIASLAKARGYKWKPYTPGFIDLNDPDERTIAMENEEAVFRFVGLEYEEPWERP
ncbi:MAG TPA: hypothetical protein VGM62_20120 [Chthoniobacterales bacterium]